MNNTTRVLAISLVCLTTAASVFSADNMNILWYQQSAESWTEALPIGNGRLGAMVFGGVKTEHLQLNEDTLYAGGPGPVGVVPIHRYAGEVFKLIQQGKYEEANRIVDSELLGRNHQTYTTLGDLRLQMTHSGKATDYRRQLDLDTALVRVTYRIGDAQYRREIFATAVNQVIVIRLTCDKPGRISLSTLLDTPHAFSRLAPIGGDSVTLTGKAPMHGCNRTIKQIRRMGDTHKYPALFDADGRLKVDATEDDNIVYAEDRDGGGMSFQAQLKAVAEGGEVTVDEKGLHVTGADTVTLLLAADTSYNGFDKSPSKQGADPAVHCEQHLRDAAKKSYTQLRDEHIADYQKLFQRVQLDLGTTEASRLPTDERIRKFAEGNDPQLPVLYFQFGRYLMISSSRPGTQPANLQGIWSSTVHAPWNGGYTTNINTEMNYWPAEVTNLAECTQPLFRLVDECVINGRKTAERSYRCRGWVTHHNVSIWRITDPIDNQARFSFWPMAGGWLCRHLWEHYLFSGDRKFLAERAYPIMKGAAEFYLDWLRTDEKGRLITPVSTSPENSFRTPDGQRASVSMGSTMDMSIIRELFANCIKASEILDVDHPFRKELEQAYGRLLPFQVGRLGQLQEWYKDWDDPNDHHRHLSHLYGLFPSSQITPLGTPKLAAAARKSLQLRGDGNVGWSKAWQVNLWARLGDVERAYDRLASLIAENSNPNLFTQCYAGRPLPFDIDPMFGAAAGMAEMLLQSHAGEIHLLPALPKAWPTGYVKGLRARGAFVVNISWKKKKLFCAHIQAKRGGICKVRYGDKVIEIKTEAGKSYSLNGRLERM